MEDVSVKLMTVQLVLEKLIMIIQDLILINQKLKYQIIILVLMVSVVDQMKF